jgi:hypothetical protein
MKGMKEMNQAAGKRRGSSRECVTRMGGTACREASADNGIERMAWQELLLT